MYVFSWEIYSDLLGKMTSVCDEYGPKYGNWLSVDGSIIARSSSDTSCLRGV